MCSLRTSGNAQQNICDCFHSFATDIFCAALPCPIFLFVHVETCPFVYTFFPLTAYCSALKKETAAISTGLVNFFQFACHHILEGGVLDHSYCFMCAEDYCSFLVSNRPSASPIYRVLAYSFCNFACFICC